MGGPRTKGEGEWRVLDGLGISKTSKLKVSALKIVGGPEGEGIEHRASRRESSSDRGDKREGLAGYCSSRDASKSRK